MLGHSGLTLLPFTPWQAVQTAALLAPASAEPAIASAATEVLANARPVQTNAAARLNENLLSIMVLRAPLKAANCTLATVHSSVPPMSLFPKVRFLVSAASEAQFPGDAGSEVAFAGRSNAGKSSAIN